MSETKTNKNAFGVSRRLYRLNAGMGFVLFFIVALTAFILHIKAASLTNRSDNESTQAMGALATHNITFNLSGANTFDTGEEIAIQFPVAFTPGGSWGAGDFAFNDGTARVIAGVSFGPGITSTVCPDAPNNVGVAFDTTTQTFRVIPCGVSFTSSIAGAYVTVTIDGTTPSGTLANPVAAGTYDIQILDGAGDCQSMGDQCSIPIVIINGQINVTAMVNGPGGGGGGGGGGGYNTPPIISNIHTQNATTTSIDVCWDTNQQSDSTVNYGADNTYGNQQVQLSLVVTRCLTLNGLSEGSTYHYQVCSKNSNNYQACSGDLTFTIPRTTPPVISSVQVTNITCNSVTVSWLTDEPATSYVDYDTVAGPPYSTTVGSATFTTSHDVDVTGLAAGQVYHYRARSADTWSNESFTGDATFAPSSSCAPDTTPPVISNVAATNITDTSAHICWDTDESSDSKLSYGTTMAYGTTTYDPTLVVLGHCFDVINLTAGTTYHYQVASKDSSNNLATSADFTFMTTGTSPSPCTVDCSVTLFQPYIINPDGTERKVGSIYVHVTHIDATHDQYNFADNAVNMDFNSVVIDVAHGDCSAVSFTLEPGTATWDHQVRSEIYYHNVLQRDVLIWASTLNASNSTVTINESNDQLVCGGNPPVISNVAATNITTNSALITWTTAGNDDSRVDYGLTSSYGLNVADAHFTTTHQGVLTGLASNTTYHYRVRSNDAAGKTAISADETFTTLPDTTPPANVTNLSAMPGDSQVTLTWTNPTDPDFAGVLIQRSTTGFPQSPTDGTTVYTGPNTSFVDVGVTNGILYYYTVFAYDGVPNYSSGSVVSAKPVGPPDTTPPGNLINFTATPGDTVVQLTWTNPSDLDYQGVQIVRKTGGFPTSRTDGTLVYNGNGSSKLDTGLTNGTTYYYGAYTYDAVPNYASGVTASATPTAPPDLTPPGPVTNLTATPSSGSVQLSWTNPSDSDFAGTRILRKTGSNPTGPADGTLVYDGNGNAITDYGLTNGTTYYYGAYSYDTSHNIASGAFANATPTAALPPPPPTCTDSDGGHDYLTVGTITVNGVAAGTDNCSDAQTLTEFYCDGTIGKSESHPCGAGYQCNTGKCEAVSSKQKGEVCGNGICAGTENSLNCPQDCPAQPVNPPLPVPKPTVPTGELLHPDDLRFLATAAKIQLRLSNNNQDLQFYRNAAFTVMLPDPSIKKAIKDAYVNFNGSAYLMRVTASYETTVQTPDQTGTLPLDVIVNYQDGTTDTVHVNVVLKNRGFVYEDTSGTPAVGGARVTLYVDNGGSNFGIWNGGPSGQANPQVTGADGTFAYIVPVGSYKLVVEKDGYDTATTLPFPINEENVISNTVGLLKTPPPLKLTDIKNVVDNANHAGQVVGNAIKNAAANPYVKQQVQNIAVPAATVATVANVAAAGAASATAIPYLLYLYSLFAHPFLLIARRRRRQWGVVYDALSKRPIDLAIVRLTDAKTGRIVRSAVTDKEGRYFFIVQRGSYRMVVVKVGYICPTTFLKNEKEDGLYIDLYHGELITVNAETTITANVPLDPVAIEHTPRRIVLAGILRRFQKALGIIAIVAMIIATIITPTRLMEILLAANVIMYFVFRRLSVTKKPKNWGIVYDEKTLRPLENVVARIFDSRFNKLLETQVTDIRGRYAFLVGKSTYYVTFEKPGYQKQQRGPVQLTDEKKSGMKVVAEDIALPRAKPGEQKPAPAKGPSVLPPPPVPQVSGTPPPKSEVTSKQVVAPTPEAMFAPSTPLGYGPLKSLPITPSAPEAGEVIGSGTMAAPTPQAPRTGIAGAASAKPLASTAVPNNLPWEAQMLARLEKSPKEPGKEPPKAANNALIEPKTEPASLAKDAPKSGAVEGSEKPLPDTLEDLLNPHLERQLLQDAEHAHPDDAKKPEDTDKVPSDQQP